MAHSLKKALVTTVTPVYSGEYFLKDLVDQLEKVRERWETQNYPFVLAEAIFVDDGSIDNSSAILVELERKHPWVHVVCLSRNFGQHPATIAGMLHSSGDWVVTLDEDLQHSPEQFTVMLRKALTESCDIVYASPVRQVHGSLYRDLASRISKHTIGIITGNPFVRNFNSFRLIRGNIARGAASVCGSNTYLDLALCWFTQKISWIKLEMKDKRYQETKTSGYSFRKLLSHWQRLFVSSQIRMFRIGAVMGLVSVFAAISGMLLVILQKIFRQDMVLLQGWASIMVAILFIGGIILFFLSLIIEYLGIILLQIQGKPTFFLADRSMDQAWLNALLEREKDDSI